MAKNTITTTQKDLLATDPIKTNLLNHHKMSVKNSKPTSSPLVQLCPNNCRLSGPIRPPIKQHAVASAQSPADSHHQTVWPAVVAALLALALAMLESGESGCKHPLVVSSLLIIPPKALSLTRH